MSVMKYKDPSTGEVKKVFAPTFDAYTKTETDTLLNSKAPATHASQHKIGGSDPITPESIGAVSKSGDTMTGDLKLKKGTDAYTLIAKKVAANGTDYGTEVQDLDSTGAITKLIIRQNVDTINRLILATNDYAYRIYGEHNKPTPEAIGASASDHTHDLSTLINALSAGTDTSVPVDDDYYISQYVGGGTTHTTYYRRKISTLWSYIKAKADSAYAALSHNHSANNITSGTLSAARGGTGQTTVTPAVGTKGVRQIYAGTTDMTASSTSLTTGVVYLVYQ